MIRAVFFDAGHTLFRERLGRAAIYAEVAARHGVIVDVGACEAAMSDAHDRLPQILHGAFRYTRGWFGAFIDAVFERLGAPPVRASLRADLFSAFDTAAAFELYPEVAGTLADLGRRGLRLGVISNWAPHLDGVLKGLGIRDHFEVVLASATELLEKPDPRLFHRALEGLGVEPAEALHVGDRADLDVEGARAAGLQALWLCRGKQPGPAGSIRTLDEIPGLFPATGHFEDRSPRGY